MKLLAKAMWLLYAGSFKSSMLKNLSESDVQAVAARAAKDYRAILAKLPPFEKDDRFKVNIINCAMLTAFLKNLENEYTLNQITAFYRDAMDNKITRYFCTHGGTYTVHGQLGLARAARRSRSYTNPYTWQFGYTRGKTPRQYTATFYTCGICRLMSDYGLARYIPAMCVFDYDMAAMNNTEFTRRYTLAAGGPYCDCNYNHRKQ